MRVMQRDDRNVRANRQIQKKSLQNDSISNGVTNEFPNLVITSGLDGVTSYVRNTRNSQGRVGRLPPFAIRMGAPF